MRRSLATVAVATGGALVACAVSLAIVLDFVLPRVSPADTTSGAANVLRVLLLVDALACVLVVAVILRERQQLFTLGNWIARERDEVRATGDGLAVQAEHMRRVLLVAERLAAVMSAQDVAAIVTPAVREITGADEAILWLAGEDGTLERVGGDSVIDEAAVYLSSSPDDSGAPPQGWAVSLVTSDEVVGVLELRGQGKPAAPVASIVEALAAHTAGAIDANRRAAKLREESHTDPLTGLPNRAALEIALTSEYDRARRTGGTMAVVMVDVDHFKSYNDLNGHQAGDAVLASIARVLSRGLRRRGDGVYRYGGEEFLIILPGTDAQAGFAAAERLRLDVKYASSSRVPGLPVTASFGVASLRDSQMSPNELLAAADAALYQAKRGGRDRVEVSQDPPSGTSLARRAG